MTRKRSIKKNNKFIKHLKSEERPVNNENVYYTELKCTNTQDMIIENIITDKCFKKYKNIIDILKDDKGEKAVLFCKNRKIYLNGSKHLKDKREIINIQNRYPIRTAIMFINP